MYKDLNKGNALAGLVVLGALFVIIFLYVIPGGNNVGPIGGINSLDFSLNSSGSQGSSGGDTSLPKSSYAKSISIGSGNASYSYQTYEEYITIENSGKNPINITGWTLQNAKDKRSYELGSSLQRYPADIVTIPKAALFVSPSHSNVFRDVILEPRDKAIITTGSVGARNPYEIVSFKENICSGYLEKLPEYKFTPALSNSCPNPAKESGVLGLSLECRNYIEGMQSCRTPEYDTRNADGSVCDGCVDGKFLPASCVAFIKNHYSYPACVANHQNDPNFSLHTWRIFLNSTWELWNTKYETISLFDNAGNLVDSLSY